MKKLLLIIFTLVSLSLSAQNTNEISLVVSGRGANEQEATLSALRSAIEQSFGTFVSANTAILNDELVKDEIVSVSQGNIKSYDKISVVNVPGGKGVIVTLKAVVSVSNLISYAKSKGSKAEFAGAVFSNNIKLMKLRAENTKKAYSNMCSLVMLMLDNAFDYTIDLGQPRSIKRYKRAGDDWQYYGNGYAVRGRINVLSNQTSDAIYRFVFETLISLSLSSRAEYHQYQQAGIDCCDLTFLGASRYWLDYKLVKLFLPLSKKTVLEMDEPVVNSIFKSYFNYSISAVGVLDYCWRPLNKESVVLGYNEPSYDTYKIFSAIYNKRDDEIRYEYRTGLGLCNSNNEVLEIFSKKNLFPEYKQKRFGDLLVECLSNWEQQHSYIELYQIPSGVFRDQIEDYLQKEYERYYKLAEVGESRFKRGGKRVTPKEMSELFNSLEDKEKQGLIQKLIPKVDQKRMKKANEAITGDVFVSYLPVMTDEPKTIMEYTIDFLFSEDEISRLSGFEIKHGHN